VPIDILCENSDRARFTALHNGVSTTLETENTPIIRDDFANYSVFTSQFGQSSGLISGQSRSIVANTQPGQKRLARLTLFNGGPVLMSTDLGFSQVLGSFDFTSSPSSQYFLGFPNSITITSLGGSVGYSYLVHCYAARWGHKVTDSKGFSMVFLTNSVNQPAAYSKTCITQCSEGFLPCESCCLDCSEVAGKLREINRKLEVYS
jgi:hypothetical protein